MKIYLQKNNKLRELQVSQTDTLRQIVQRIPSDLLGNDNRETAILSNNGRALPFAVNDTVCVVVGGSPSDDKQPTIPKDQSLIDFYNDELAKTQVALNLRFSDDNRTNLRLPWTTIKLT